MMRDAFERRGTMMHSMLSAIPGVTCLEPQGAFYCFPNVDRAARPRHPRHDVRDHARARRPRAVARPRWRSCPGEAFGAPGYARFSFALGDADLAEGISRISQLVD